MAKKVISIEGKRPADATPEKALELSKTLTQEEIGHLWGISRQRVQQLIAKAKESVNHADPLESEALYRKTLAEIEARDARDAVDTLVER